MSEKCLIMTSIAILVCHPSSTIRCFKPKSEKPPSKHNNEKSNKPLESIDSHAKRVFSFPRFKEIKVPFELLEELVVGDGLLSVVEAIFRFGWKNKVGYKFHKVFRVNHGEKVHERFEEYRKIVKSRSKRLERDIGDDGNEVFRYRGTAITCALGVSQFTNACNKRSCGVCRIIGHSSHAREMSIQPITLSKTSWSAHRRVEKCGGGRDDNKKAILVCKVIAGRVASWRNGDLVDGEEDGDFDSVEFMDGSEKFVVLDSRAILPCFVVLYDVL